MRTFHHLTLPEREWVWLRRSQGCTFRAIAVELYRSHTSLVRELRRNTDPYDRYYPCVAEKRAGYRRLNQRRVAPLKQPLIYQYIREHLRLGWSPEQIAGRLPLDHPGFCIDDETIYRYIYATATTHLRLWRFLRYARKKRMKKLGRRVRRLGKIPGALSIEERPPQVAYRSEIGHWESDNLYSGPVCQDSKLSKLRASISFL